MLYSNFLYIYINMLRNILVAFSNTFAIFPIYQSIIYGDYLTCLVLTFVTSSFISHLVENHKHGMPGIGFSKNISYFLNRLDVFGCVMVILRLMYLYWLTNGFYLMWIYNNNIIVYWSLITFSLNFISEYDKYNVTLQPLYLVTHILWHINIFLLIDYFLRHLIYCLIIK
jgi:hypothetical protein